MEDDVGLIIIAMLVVVPFWRIFDRAGFSPAYALLLIIPAVGFPIASAFLAFAEWPERVRRNQA